MKRLENVIEQEIKEQHIPGILGGVSVKEKETIFFSYGKADILTQMEMKRDTIFRLYSMSKPICAVGAWILMEQGKIHLDDPIANYLPEYGQMKMMKNGDIVDCQDTVRIRELLNMTAGFTYGDPDTVGTMTDRLFKEIHRRIDKGSPIKTREVVRKLAEIPLAFSPGERWRYGLCADVLGAVIEVVSGMTLGEYYRQAIFEPLGMNDTGFYVPREKQNRFAPLYKTIREKTKGTSRLEYDFEHHLGLGDFKTPPAFESAGAGLVSTYEDYMKFAQMLANGGVRNGTKILSRKTVEQFTKNQLSQEKSETVYFEHMRGYGYGNFMRVCLEGMNAPVPGKEKSFGWDGWCGPYMSVDLVNSQAIVFFIQVAAYAGWEFNAKLLRELLS